jgi:hypothetical protein
MLDATRDNSDQACRRNGGKVLLGIEYVVEKIRQGVHGDQRDDLHDVRVRVAGIADGFQIGVTDMASSLDDFASELDCGIPLESLAWPFRASMISLAGSLAICSAVKL